MDTLSTLVDAALSIEKVRVRSQVRQSHLKLDGRDDKETDDLVIKLTEIEEYVDGRVASILKEHPAYPWFSQIKGIGKENIGKVVGLIDIEKATTISALWKFAGYAPVDGHAEKRVKGGGKLHYNAQLRTMCWRLGSSLMRSKGSFYDYYNAQKDQYIARCTAKGIKIVPATQLPTEGGKKTESEGYISEGHIHNMALRKMIKLFLACLWLEWRKSLKMPITNPYVIDKLEHEHMIESKEMIDKPGSQTSR